MSRAKSAPRAKAISGVRALGDALGVSHVTAGNYVNHADWPYGKGPWTAEQVAEMRRWSQETLRPANEPPEDPEKQNLGKRLNGAKLQKIVRECQLLDVKIAKEKKELVKRADAEADCVRKLEAVKRAMRAMPDGLPYDQAIKDEVRRHVDRTLELLVRVG